MTENKVQFSSENEKVKLSKKATSMLFSFLIGAQTLIFPGLVGALNVQMGEVFNKKYYNYLMIILQTPSFALVFFVPKLLENLGHKRANYYNFTINSACNVAFASVFLMGMYVPDRAFIFLCLTAIFSRAANSISESGLMSIAETLGTPVQLAFVAGSSASNFVVAGLKSILKKSNLSIELYMCIFFISPVLYNLLAFTMFLKLNKKYEQEKTINQEEDDSKKNEKRQTENEGVVFVCKNRCGFAFLLWLMFFFIFLVYPNLMYKINNNDTNILYVYSGCEFFARILNAGLYLFYVKKDKKILEKCPTTIAVIGYCFLCIWAFCLYLKAHEIVPFVMLFNSSPIPKWVVYVTYVPISFGHGFLGSVLCSHITGGFKRQSTKNAANTLYIALIMCAVVAGSIISSAIDTSI